MANEQEVEYIKDAINQAVNYIQQKQFKEAFDVSYNDIPLLSLYIDSLYHIAYHMCIYYSRIEKVTIYK